MEWQNAIFFTSDSNYLTLKFRSNLETERFKKSANLKIEYPTYNLLQGFFSIILGRQKPTPFEGGFLGCEFISFG